MSRLADHKAEGDLIYSASKSLRMSAQKGEISTYNVSSSQVLGVRAIKDGRVGLSYTESFDDESLALLVKQALQNGEVSGVNLNERILDLNGNLNDEKSYMEPETDIGTKTAKALELESKVKAMDPRVVTVPYNGYSENEYQSHYLSSRGRSTSYADKSYSISTSALLDEKGKKATFYDFDVAHTFADLQWNRVIENSVLHARELLGEKSLPTGKYSVRFTEDCLKSLIECFANFYSAKAAMDKINPWSERLGHEVISKDLTFIDDPLYPAAFRATHFDSEGVKARALTLIENGSLNSFCHNSITAGYFGTETTGHAYRSAGGPLSVSGSHFVIRGKNKKQLPQRYLEVIQMEGLQANANRVNGNFSMGVKGYVWEDGQRTMTFGNVTLSGNLMELLNRVEVIGEELRSSTDRSFFSVPLIFGGFSLAGT